MVDALQRSVLFLDLMRQRGDEEIDITSRPLATVLRFDHEVLIGVEIDPSKRPVVVIDPRAGQGSGIGGFKAVSEIGDA
jgi:hypothetical protein